MPQFIERDEVRRLAGDGAQIVEVLGESEFQQQHLPGAVNLPLRQLHSQAPEVLRPHDPVVVYCWDSA